MFLKDIFSEQIILKFFFCLKILKMLLHSSHLLCFWKSCHLPHPTCTSGYFTFFSLSLTSSNLIMMHLGVVLYIFLMLEFCWFSWSCGYIMLIKFEIILLIDFSNIFSTTVLSLWAWITCILGHWKMCHSLQFCLHCFKLLFLYLSLDNFYYYVSTLSNFSICDIHSTINPIWYIYTFKCTECNFQT